MTSKISILLRKIQKWKIFYKVNILDFLGKRNMPLHSGVHATKIGDAINFQEASQATTYVVYAPWKTAIRFFQHTACIYVQSTA